ncbi:MAG TPA: tetraacyldisaccharide 4'-kinase, partial [Pirellulales bacterium]|nr:tetraacyldisaccharide 4'-kinase [Pirellulales bacterium]
MFLPSDFRRLVSGERRGLAAMAARISLRVAEIPYTLAVCLRNRRFDQGRPPIERVAVPVVSVGNLTLGGTGKTPLVEWLARWFRRRQVRLTLISRGYGAERGAVNDEALELERRLPDVPHVQNRDRVAAARLAIEEFECQLILLDDAFQHRRMARDLDIVLIDALEPFGFGHVFPRGTLREPVAGLARAQVVALSRADMLDAGRRSAIRNEVRRHAPRALWLELTHAPRRLVSADGGERSLETLSGMRVAAFCGIGNPAGFRHTLQACGADVLDFREFEDHHAYHRGDVEALAAWAQRLDVAATLCTAKDLVKLRVARLGGRPL